MIHQSTEGGQGPVARSGRTGFSAGTGPVQATAPASFSLLSAVLAAVLLMAGIVATTGSASGASPVISAESSVETPAKPLLWKLDPFVMVIWTSADYDVVNVYRNNKYIDTVEAPTNYYIDRGGDFGDVYYLVGVRDGQFSLKSPTETVADPNFVPARVPRVLVIGDSISAGWKQPSYRKPMLDILAQADCTVDMVGDQTVNGYDYKRDQPGYNYFGFDRNAGYDIDHQAIPGISAAQYASGLTQHGIEPAATYVQRTDPDFILIHLGSNDLSSLVNNASASTKPIAEDIVEIAKDALTAHPRPNEVQILIANVIPYSRMNLSTSQEANADKLSRALADDIEAEINTLADSRVSMVDVRSNFIIESMTFDRLHPNNRGEEHIARAFVRALDDAGLCPDASLPTQFPPLPAAEPTLTQPIPGHVLKGPVATVEWAYLGENPRQWYLRVGSTRGGSQYFESRITNPAARAIQVSGLPSNGETVWVEFSDKRSIWSIRNYAVTAVR